METNVFEGLHQRLCTEFNLLNKTRFDGLIPEYKLKLSRVAVHTHGSINLTKKVIRISVLLYDQHGWEAVRQTLLHEMTHAYIHLQGGQARHTKKFWSELVRRGGRRDKLEIIPKSAYVYACSTCGGEVKRLRKITQPWRYSCKRCDKRYNPRHRLYLKKDRFQTTTCGDAR